MDDTPTSRRWYPHAAAPGIGDYAPRVATRSREPVPATPPHPAGVLICANPYSGARGNAAAVAGVSAALRGAGLEPRVVWDAAERAATLADPDLAGWCRCVVAAGGDGSLGDTINDYAAGQRGVSQTGSAPISPQADDVPVGPVPIATYPIGNENLFAREFGYTRNPHALAHTLAAGHTRTIDLGRVRQGEGEGEGEAAGRLFTLMASAGFDADVVDRMTRWRGAGGTTPGGAAALRRVGRLNYLPRIVAAVREYHWRLLELEVDGERITGSHVFLFNLPQYGMKLERLGGHARCDDGLLDYVVFHRPGPLAMAQYAAGVLRSVHLDRDDVTHGRARRMALRAQPTDNHPSASAPLPPLPLQADGDLAGQTPAHIDALPAALRVVVPPAYSPL